MNICTKYLLTPIAISFVTPTHKYSNKLIIYFNEFYAPTLISLLLRVRKILNLRLFDDENGRAWSKSVMDKEYEVLCVSQFTLQCILKGNKPDFHAAMPAELSQPFYNNILEHLRSTYKPEMIKGW